MPQLIETRKKIQSVQNTRKITKAMELVAANKMKRFQSLAVASRRYAWSLLDGLRLMGSSFSDLPFAGRRAEGKRLFVVVTSDKGLCGALNQQVLRVLFRSKEWTSTPEGERLLVTVGRKSEEAARARGIPAAAAFQGLPEELGPLDALAVVDRILSFWTGGECRDVLLASPHYVNAFTSKATLKTFLPFSEEMVREHLQFREDPDPEAEARRAMLGQLFYEPSQERVLDAMSRQLAQMLFLSAFYELKASEYSSRMLAMRHATEAADEMIGTLTLDYNKVRQAAITQQLAEIVGAIDAEL
jgi:F-type H+-transporting ATPase subunit gamma